MSGHNDTLDLDGGGGGLTLVLLGSCPEVGWVAFGGGSHTKALVIPKTAVLQTRLGKKNYKCQQMREEGEIRRKWDTRSLSQAEKFDTPNILPVHVGRQFMKKWMKHDGAALRGDHSNVQKLLNFLNLASPTHPCQRRHHTTVYNNPQICSCGSVGWVAWHLLERCRQGRNLSCWVVTPPLMIAKANLAARLVVIMGCGIQRNEPSVITCFSLVGKVFNLRSSEFPAKGN